MYCLELEIYVLYAIIGTRQGDVHYVDTSGVLRLTAGTTSSGDVGAGYANVNNPHLFNGGVCYKPGSFWQTAVCVPIYTSQLIAYMRCCWEAKIYDDYLCIGLFHPGIKMRIALLGVTRCKYQQLTHILTRRNKINVPNEIQARGSGLITNRSGQQHVCFDGFNFVRFQAMYFLRCVFW